MLHVRKVYVRGVLKFEGKTRLSSSTCAALRPCSGGARARAAAARHQAAVAVRAAGFVDAEGKATKRIYDLRHTFAIHALVPSFIIARVMGTSEAMLRKHYGHLLPDTDDLVRERLNAWDAENEAFGHLSGTGGE